MVQWSCRRCAMGLHRVVQRMVTALGVEVFCWDPCGMIMAGITWFLVLWGNYKGLSYLDVSNPADVLMGLVYQSLMFLAFASHFRTMCTNPGFVPLRPIASEPMVEINRNEPQWVDGQLVTNCRKCDGYKPWRAHHCSVCRRCVRMMDHHCPWVNNCVGEENHKHFILFTSYIFLSSVWALGIVVRFLYSCDTRWHRCVGTRPWDIMSLMLFFMEIFMFGLFTIIMSCDQMCGIAYDTTTLERLKGDASKPAPSPMQNLRAVFGATESKLYWVLPTKRRKPPDHAPGSISIL